MVRAGMKGILNKLNRWNDRVEKLFFHLKGIAEELLSSLERHVLERMRINLDDAVLNGDPSVSVDATTWFHSLNQQAQFVAQRRVIRHHVDTQRSAFVWQNHQLRQ